MSKPIAGERQSLQVAVLTVSDTRTDETDTSGNYLVEQLKADGHTIADKKITPDDVYKIRAIVSQWIASDEVHIILTTGGTGFTLRDSTPEAVSVLFDKTIDGFGELFRAVSYEEIGSSTIQSRAIAGIANNTVIFSMPGSTNACQTAWHKILQQQLDSTYRPCNFAGVLHHRANS